MEALIAKLDPFTGLLVLGVIALYVDARRDRAKYQDSIQHITDVYHETLKQTTDALGAIRAELALMGQTIGNLRRRIDD